MLKAMECVNEYKTLPSFFTKIIETPSDNKTIPNNNDKIVTPEDKPKDSPEESPDQQQEESNGIPETIFQG